MPSHPRACLAIVSVLAVLLAAPAGALPAADRLPAGCVAADLDDAATHLLGPGTEVVSVDGATALVLTPGVYPGVRHRLMRTDGGWCPAASLNLLAPVTSPVRVAERAVTVLPAPFFDGITVLESALVAPGVVELTTHARTNGVVARWTVTIDALGVREASWEALEFAVPPFEPQWEGLTAVPGATWSYARTATGQVEPTQTIEDLLAADEPSPTISYTTQDEFTIHVSVGDAHFAPQAANTIFGTSLPTVYGGVAPDPDMDTGNANADYLRIMGEAVQVNADDFYDWGLRKGWRDEEGNLYVDGALSAYCWACVLVSEYFNVHMHHAIYPALEALGYSYPDERLALIDIVGHEMVHNYQNAYGKPNSVGGGRHNSYSEGTARFSETLHSYSHVSHQPESLIYANNTNGCNGWQGGNADAAFAAGPLTGQSYDACYFWMTVHADHGVDALVGLIENSQGLPAGRPWEIYAGAIQTATGVALDEVLANFAAMALTGRDYRWGAPADPEWPVLDWAVHLDRWSPSREVAAGRTVEAMLRDGGMAAWELVADAPVLFALGDVGAAAVVTDDGAESTVTLLQDGDRYEPAAGTRAWVVLINAGTANGLVSVEVR